MVVDFGLAKLTTDTNTHVSIHVMGTFGILFSNFDLELSSDGGLQAVAQRSLSDVEIELREMRLSLLMGIEKRKLAEEAQSMQQQWQILREKLGAVGLELNWEEPAGAGGPNAERYIIDARAAVVERRAVVSRERLILSHCLVLSVLVVRTSKCPDTV
ncbi:hypothetical protein BVRB_1g014110 [Beta vulgaris subsp. vulgaris]|nr:hypothetical protein BVRB_1g014110 [Beta vulgaris subsp. vulgaris]